ncbi:GPH family glycoside/pentoside/hexuronide:cation symporter [Paenibacillus castaneae]|uniref:MFS transporter n=1 Tax=Paenibacillus castaneae TaxID=474957 RepID=UPI000C99E1FD|nr:glycoside-pentoside-hexuronide (GPH):cation symporter [Paenibacillus castaneae]NIK77138.1 GPH family glycoside/pentoside/hexuronide:cation symporter [Paenibacillus castaneae]
MNAVREVVNDIVIPSTEKVRKFGNRDKIGYMFGDMGNDLFFALIGGYLMLFYTDIYGISAAAAGMILLVARVLDAIFDIAWGSFIDSRPVGPRGKFRPYLLFSAIPVTAFGVLTFMHFPVNESWKVVVASIAYIVWGLAYSTINIPYGSMASVITTDPIERTSLSTFRTLGALLANVFIMVVAPMIIFGSGKSPTAQGFLTIAAICAVLANVFYFSSYKLSVERVRVSKPSKKNNLLKSLKGIAKNRALLGLMLTSFGFLASYMTVNALTPYLFKDYFHAPNLIALSGLIGLASSFLAMPIISPLAKRFGKKETATIGLIIAFVVNTLMFLLPITSPYVYMVLNCISGFGLAFLNILIWALVSDCIDNQERITGNREEGTVYSVYSLVRKIGQAAAGGIGGFALVAAGYNSGIAEQSEKVAAGIKSIITLVPALGSLIALLSIYLLYNLTKKNLVKLNEELTIMRQE